METTRFIARRALALCGAAVIAASLLPTCADADQVKIRGRTEPYAGLITRYDPDTGNVDIDTGSGEITLEKNQIEWIRVEQPPELKDWLAASTEAEISAAIAGLRPLMNKILGIPETRGEPWVAHAALRLADFYRAKQIWSEATAMDARVKKLYPPLIGRHADIGMARTQMGLQNYDEALKTLEALLKPVAGTLIFTPVDSPFYARAYIAHGDCLAAKQRWREALTSYLTVTVLCYHDKSLLAEARYKAGQMFEQISEWARVADVYSELLRDAPPQTPFLDDVKKRLEKAQEKARQQGSQ
jgi:tetratricopeptide (TPR) repeat protein